MCLYEERRAAKPKTGRKDKSNCGGGRGIPNLFRVNGRKASSVNLKEVHIGIGDERKEGKNLLASAIRANKKKIAIWRCLGNISREVLRKPGGSSAAGQV